MQKEIPPAYHAKDISNLVFDEREGKMSEEDDQYEDFDAPPPPPPTDFHHQHQHQEQYYENNEQYAEQQFQDEYSYQDQHHSGGMGEEDDHRHPPPPWERHYSVEDEAFYYFNPDSGECIWEQQEEDEDDEVMDEDEFEDFLRQHQDELQHLGYNQPGPAPEYTQTEEEQQQDAFAAQPQHHHQHQQQHQQEEADFYRQQHIQQQQQQYQYPPPPPQEYDDFESDNISLADLASLDMAGDDHSVSSNMTGLRSVRTNMTDPNLTVVERSNMMLQYKQEKMDALRREKERQERDSLQAHPTITSKSKQKQRSVEDMLQWDKERQARLQAKTQLLEEQQKTEQTGRPQVTKFANKLAQKWREDEEDATLGNYDTQSVATSLASKSVQERLYEYDERKKMKLQMMIDRQNQEARLNAKPTLVSRRAHYIRGNQSVASGEEGSVADRLYALAELRHANPMPSMMHGTKPIQHDEATGQRLFEPKINRTSEKLANRARAANMPIEDWLYMKGIEYQRKVEIKERRKAAQEEQMRGVSKINPNSEKMVRDRYLLYGESTADRLHRPIGAFKSRTIETMNKFNFKPKISEGSLEILQQGGNRYRYFPPDQTDDVADDLSHIDSIMYGESDGQAICVDGKEFSLLPQNRAKVNNPSRQSAAGMSMYERTLYWEEQRKKRLEQDRLEYERTQMRECSFKPKVDPNSKAIQSSKGNIADRHSSWVKEREDKLALKRQQQAIDEIKDCTFVPKVPMPTSSGGRARSGSKSSTSAKPSVYEDASTLLPPEPGSSKVPTANKINVDAKVRFRDAGGYPQEEYNQQEAAPVQRISVPVSHSNTYYQQQQPGGQLPLPTAAYQPPVTKTVDYSAFDFGDDEYTPKAAASRSRPQPVPVPQPSQQQYTQPPYYQSQQQQQQQQHQYPPQQYAVRPTDFQEPEDYPLSPSSWIAPQQYGADFNALELKAQKSLRNSYPASDASQVSQITDHSYEPATYHTQQTMPPAYQRSPTNPYNMHYYADPPDMDDDDMSHAVEL